MLQYVEKFDPLPRNLVLSYDLERSYELKDEARALSSMLLLPISTIHRRIKRLEEDGVINGYRAIVDFEKTSSPIGAILMIDLFEVLPGKGHIPKKVIVEYLEKLVEVEEIVDVQAVDFDLLVRARFSSLRRLSEFMEELRCIEGIKETKSAIITQETVLHPKPIIRVNP